MSVTRNDRITRLLAAGFAASIALSGAVAAGSLTTAEAAPITVAAVTNPAQTQQAADWIAQQWASNPAQFTAGNLEDAILALASSESHSDVVAEMVDTLLPLAVDNSYNAGSAGKLALVAAVVGKDPRSFGGVDLIDVTTTSLATDPTAGGSFGLALAVLGLTRNNVDVPAAALAEVVSQQGPDGGYGYIETWNNNNFVTDPDSTALMISALLTLDGNGADPSISTALTKAQAWAKQNTTAPGYWDNYSPANTTGLMAAALADAGVDVQAATTWLKGIQLGDGGFPAALGSTDSNLMATNQAILGLAGASYATVTLVAGDPTPTPSAPASSAPASSAPVTSAPASPDPSSSAASPSVTVSSTPTTRPIGLPDTGDEGTPAALWVTLGFGAVAAGALVARRR
ncbi:prenyltransferase/squalene oxidase repeat-containing protein [Aestuariimicrobium sp. T2.26MG-19.2B]|uniref:prenyltransferase/squalene oxidase repeat-containing protein n=1 Tax=Aestuariimicrobium sp. T2.26MG-19.2B TaxID=3040679 RepID=UPI0024775761|nr:prenyltransferase/squalene oxidase repeat-containing protein [Aestuariimicrobium sp. T2.26MG-19.2B]CAI9406859.1 hypothetical protein AESSP_01708 [Aestuariimicrobium sp. T2.26MG-19.2B]